MISAHLIHLIENHAARLADDVAKDLISNPRTRSFRTASVEELSERAFQIFGHLGTWIENPATGPAHAEFVSWGSRRFGQGIPLSEIVYAVIVMKLHLRRYIRDHGLVDAAFPRVEADYILPMHLHNLQELNGQVSAFFDEALFALAEGYEHAATTATR
jgi:hypothetical protein